jgi:hypothetical protein
MGELEMCTLACTSGSEGSVSTVLVTTSVDMRLGVGPLGSLSLSMLSMPQIINHS